MISSLPRALTHNYGRGLGLVPDVRMKEIMDSLNDKANSLPTPALAGF